MFRNFTNKNGTVLTASSQFRTAVLNDTFTKNSGEVYVKSSATSQIFRKRSQTVLTGFDKGVVNGLAPLDAALHVPTANLSNAVMVHRSDIPNAADLNLYVSTGIYQQRADAQALAGLNYPTGTAGTLTVRDDNFNGLFITQEYIAYSTGLLYTRSYYNGIWYAWQQSATQVGLNTAQATANTGVTNAATAQATANTGVTNAAAAQATANTGVTNAAAAQATANAAIPKADRNAVNGVEGLDASGLPTNSLVAPNGKASNLAAGTDLNYIGYALPSGLYDGLNMVNTPQNDKGWWYVQNYRHSSNIATNLWAYQVATAFGSAHTVAGVAAVAAGATYERHSTGGTGVWSAWMLRTSDPVWRSATPPTNTAAYPLWADTTTDQFNYWTGTTWVTVTGQQIPTGAAIPFFGGTVHTGFLKANGAAISRTAYAVLFAEIGTVYGVGDGTTTFNLPDSRGEFLRGFDDASGVDAGRALGSWQADAMQGHRHASLSTGFASNNPTTWSQSINLYGGVDPTTGNPVTDTVNGTPRISNENRPRNLAVQFLIKY